MDQRLLTDEALERSDVVANCHMNRERRTAGTNSYAAELPVNPLDFLSGRLTTNETVAWLDLCCGTGKALVQAGRHFRELGLEDRVAIHGVDLVDIFDPAAEKILCVTLQAASLREWTSDAEFDLITCVHGLHYIGDKLGLITKAVCWLKSDGLFLGHLDIDNLKLTSGRWIGGTLGKHFKKACLNYDRKRRLLRCQGKRLVEFPFSYEGADDTAGPNFTRQPAVDSYYSYRMDV